MAADYTTTELIANLKRRAFLSPSSGLDTAALLRILSEQLRTYVPAFLKGLREEYVIASLEVAVSNGVVNAPARAAGAAFRTIKWKMADGSHLPLSRIEPENSNNPGAGATVPYGYTLQGNKVLLVPSSVSGTVVLTYQQRGGQLVLPGACALITSAPGGQSLVVESMPSTFASGTSVDIVKGTPNFDLLLLEGAIDVIDTSTDLSLVDPYPGTVEPGDYLCLAGETCIAPIIPEAHDLLAQAAAAQLASSTGSARAGEIKGALKDLRDELTVLLSPRDDGSPRTIVSKSRLGSFQGW